MHALFFEVTPKPGHDDHYFNIAAALKPRVEQNPGLLFLDRYRSLTRPDTILSYQHWRDEAALADWRRDEKHKAAQSAGRNTHFDDYRIRIAEVTDGFFRGGDTPATNQGRPSGPDARNASLIMAVESKDEAFPRGEPFSSVNREGAFVSLLHIGTSEEAVEILNDARALATVTGAILCRTVRDYGMRSRAQAPADLRQAEDVG